MRKLSIFKNQIFMFSTTACRFTPKVSLKELKAHTFTRCRNTLTGFLTGPPTIGKTGVFVSPTTSSNSFRKMNTKCSIDASLEDGHLTYGEYYLKGRTDAEILISTHVCHPSLANDNLPASLWQFFSPGRLGGPSLRYSLPLSLYPRNYRVHHLAEPKRG